MSPALSLLTLAVFITESGDKPKVCVRLCDKVDQMKSTDRFSPYLCGTHDLGQSSSEAYLP